ncbi:hypothetical protein BY996DRAFT_8400328 [Phakopsora pachyrhizi]|nr:hypothetical protein BY996DRAFT_8400328 [Phakopsora pachyrhizi]
MDSAGGRSCGRELLSLMVCVEEGHLERFEYYSINQITTSHQSINQQQHAQDKLVQEKTIFVLFSEMVVFYHMGPLRAIAGGCGLRKHYRFDEQEMCNHCAGKLVMANHEDAKLKKEYSGGREQERANCAACGLEKKLLGGDYKQREMIRAEVSLGYYLHLKANHYNGKPSENCDYAGYFIGKSPRNESSNNDD